MFARSSSWRLPAAPCGIAPFANRASTARRDELDFFEERIILRMLRRFRSAGDRGTILRVD